MNESLLKIKQYVAEKRLKDALDMAASLAAALANRRIAEAIADVEQSYRYMLDYALQGADDPGRQDMWREFGSRVLALADRLERDSLSKDDPSLYFNTLRYEALQREDSIPSMLQEYASMVDKDSMFNFVVSGTHSGKFRQSLEHREQLERRIFNRIWTVHPLSSLQISSIQSALNGDNLPDEFKILIIWALTLGGLNYYDEHRLELMLDVYSSCVEKDLKGEKANARLSAAAIVGALLLMYHGRKRGVSKKVSTRIEILAERSNDFRNDLKTCYLEFAKTIDTDRISKKISDEIVPEILKLKPEIDKKMKSEGLQQLDIEELEENPEWSDMLENSGIADKLREMSEIQEEGGDVMMATFAHLKTFPFFNEPYGWFLPFRTDFSEFTGDDSEIMQPMAEMIAKAPFLCDSDKYSFIFSVKRVPQGQREIMLQQFRAQGEHLAEAMAASLSINEDRKNAINKTVQNVFRFFTLFRRKGEFFNPFEAGVNLVEIDVLKPLVSESGILPLVGEFYFSHGYYPQAIGAFKALAEDAAFTPDSQYYQKLGYAYQKNGEASPALEAYRRAEMLAPMSDWTQLRLVNLLMAQGDYSEALRYLSELEKRQPEKASIALNIGRCRLGAGQTDEALRALFKAEYLGAKPEKVLRPLAWALLKSGDFERAGKYYEKIMLTLHPEASDYLNMGHLALAEGRLRDALNFYSLNVSIRVEAGNVSSREFNRRTAIDGLIADINADIPVLKSIGIDPTLVPLIVDALIFNM